MRTPDDKKIDPSKSVRRLRPDEKKTAVDLTSRAKSHLTSNQREMIKDLQLDQIDDETKKTNDLLHPTLKAAKQERETLLFQRPSIKHSKTAEQLISLSINETNPSVDEMQLLKTFKENVKRAYQDCGYHKSMESFSKTIENCNDLLSAFKELKIHLERQETQKGLLGIVGRIAFSLWHNESKPEPASLQDNSVDTLLLERILSDIDIGSYLGAGIAGIFYNRETSSKRERDRCITRETLLCAIDRLIERAEKNPHLINTTSNKNSHP